MFFKKLFKTLAIAILIVAMLCVMINAYMVLSERGAIVDADAAASFDADGILVLGASVIDNSRPSVMLRDRLDTACAVALDSGVPLIMSGDSRALNYDEASVMAAYAREAGVPESGVLRDPLGISTYDSVLRAKTVFGCDRLVIVTQRYHLYRALFLAKMNGVDAVGVASDGGVYEDHYKNSLREFFARVKDFASAIIGLDSSNIEFL